MDVSTMKKVLLTCFTLLPLLAKADGSIGIVGDYSQSLYKDTDNQTKVLPSFSYEGERAYVKLPEIGYHLIPKASYQSLSVGLRYQPSAFDPDDSNDSHIQLMDDRDDSTMAVVNYRWGPVSLKMAQDISGVHDGYFGQVSLGYPIQTSIWQLIPSVSYRYLSDKMSDYLFGVSSSDASRTGGSISAYDAPSTTELSVGIRAIYPISPNTSFMLNVKHTEYDEEIKQSPIVTENKINSITAALLYNF